MRETTGMPRPIKFVSLMLTPRLRQRLIDAAMHNPHLPIASCPERTQRLAEAIQAARLEMPHLFQPDL